MAEATLDRLGEHARQMRKAPTEPEKRLWRHLSRSQLNGYKFRRQSVIGPHIADFLCPQKALVVEVDGDTHSDPAADQRRDRTLTTLGYTVVHVANHDVMTNMDGVLSNLVNVLDGLADRWPSAPPQPLP
ncbi:endonuclease domain-containing protein [Sphingomonas sanxanigenens]|nr:endonuclease domain-containing protein [Sphingomonas sanxanigenens]